MHGHRRIAGGALVALGLVAAATVRIIRVLPLVADDPRPAGDDKKGEKMDKKKMGDGPRTREKKAKKGK